MMEHAEFTPPLKDKGYRSRGTGHPAIGSNLTFAFQNTRCVGFSGSMQPTLLVKIGALWRGVQPRFRYHSARTRKILTTLP